MSDIGCDEDSGSARGACGGDVETDHDHMSECRSYRFGECRHPDTCGQEEHPRITYPSGSAWNMHHVDRLRFVTYQFKIGYQPIANSDYQVVHHVICKWLLSSESDLRRILGGSNDSAVAEKLRKLLKATSLEVVLGHEEIPVILSDIANELQEDQDCFLQTLRKFSSNHDMESEDEKTLITAVTNYRNTSNLPPFHISTLLTWIEICKDYRLNGYSQGLLDELLITIINSVSYQTGCPVKVKQHKAASSITVCGQNVSVGNDIEVSGANGGVLHVITSAESNVRREPATPEDVLPYLVSKALTVADKSAFASQKYCTVYQLSIQVCDSPDDSVNHIHVFLVRCHISRNTLESMSHCPIPNPLKQSYLLYEKIPCLTIYNATLISILYRTLKSLMLLFQKI
ncbi:uncharacterized protein [Ptychodera flava]|uniref:uncharacterized protein n=1 Tax=Ptychodera flava TaxID=63121 RepID=UPI00396AA33A